MVSKQRLHLTIGEENGPQSYVVWDLEELSESESSLTITVYPFILAKLPKPLAYLPHILWVKPRLRSYLKSVVGGFHYYSTEGKSVQEIILEGTNGSLEKRNCGNFVF